MRAVANAQPQTAVADLGGPIEHIGEALQVRRACKTRREINRQTPRAGRRGSVRQRYEGEGLVSRHAFPSREGRRVGGPIRGPDQLPHRRIAARATIAPLHGDRGGDAEEQQVHRDGQRRAALHLVALLVMNETEREVQVDGDREDAEDGNLAADVDEAGQCRRRVSELEEIPAMTCTPPEATPRSMENSPPNSSAPSTI